MIDLRGKVVVITGAGRPHGVGRETALRFAEAGAKIVIADLDATDSTPKDTARQEIYGVLPDLHAVAEEIRRMGTEIEAISTDVSIESEVEHLVNTAVERFGTIDVMVTNAAIVADRQSDPLTLDVNIFNRVLAVNLTGAFLEGVNFDNADLTDAVLVGTQLGSVKNMETATLCRTTMPDGTTNNSGC